MSSTDDYKRIGTSVVKRWIRCSRNMPNWRRKNRIVQYFTLRYFEIICMFKAYFYICAGPLRRRGFIFVSAWHHCRILKPVSELTVSFIFDKKGTNLCQAIGYVCSQPIVILSQAHFSSSWRKEIVQDTRIGCDAKLVSTSVIVVCRHISCLLPSLSHHVLSICIRVNCKTMSYPCLGLCRLIGLRTVISVLFQ